VGAAAEAIGRIVGDVRQALAAVATLAAPSATQTPERPIIGSRDDRTSETASEARTDDRSIAGYCPACGWESLTRANGGRVTCGRLECQRPTAADEILADSETEHVVHLFAGTFTIRHPLRERLDDQLMRCDLHDHIASLAGPPAAPGRYRALGEGDDWTWQAIAEESTP
jgi:hypothetical protein